MYVCFRKFKNSLKYKSACFSHFCKMFSVDIYKEKLKKLFTLIYLHEFFVFGFYLFMNCLAEILKVIATLLRNSPQCPESMEVRRAFLSDMIKLFNNSRENRR